jgi:WD40 repeat protein
LKEPVRSHFCPVGSGKDDICFVAASEDSVLYFFEYGVRRDKKVKITPLPGHSTNIYDVSWSFDESLLASCDSSGLVFVWKTQKFLLESADKQK